MKTRSSRIAARSLAAAAFAGGVTSNASATVPSMFAAQYNRIVVDCSQVSRSIANDLCQVVTQELQAQSKVPVVAGGNPGRSDIVVHVRANTSQRVAGNIELALWLSRPVGRNGEPSVKPPKTAFLQAETDGRLLNPRPAVRQAVRSIFGVRPRFARAPSPPRAQ